LDSIDISTVVGLGDRALISVMTFAFARIGAVVGMRVEDYFRALAQMCHCAIRQQRRSRALRRKAQTAQGSVRRG